MKKKILLITSIKDGTVSWQPDALQQFCTAANTHGSDTSYDYCAVQQLIFEVTSDLTRSIRFNGKELTDIADVIYIRNGDKFSDYANALRLYAQEHSVHIINEHDSTYPYFGKVSQGFLFAQYAITTPPLISSPSNKTLAQYLKTHRFTYPFVLKHNLGIKGQHNYLIKNEAQLEILKGKKEGFVAQPFIKSVGELRVLTFGPDQEPILFRKTLNEKGYLHNTEQGGTAVALVPADIDPDLLSLAYKATKVTHRDIGGVDILLGEDGRGYVLEVNHTPALYSGVFLPEKAEALTKYIQHYPIKQKRNT